MPPLVQPRTLLRICYAKYAFTLATAIKHAQHEPSKIDVLRRAAGNLPSLILETLYCDVLNVCVAPNFITSANGEDDKDILVAYCKFLNAALEVLLHSHVKCLEQSFILDMRTFGNFDLRRETLYLEDVDDDQDDKDNDRFSIKVTEELFEEIGEVSSLGSLFHNFVRVASNLTVFDPGIYLLDRSLSEILYRSPVSLCWTNNAPILISLVDMCQEITVLNLEGYLDVNDLMLDYICGVTSHNKKCGGLKNLTKIALPRKSFVSTNGFKGSRDKSFRAHGNNQVKVLLENLPLLERIMHPGKIATVFEGLDDLKPTFTGCLKLKELCQRESTSSGGVTDLDEWLSESDGEEEAFAIAPWQPTSRAVERIKKWCPDLTAIRVLIDDEHMQRLVSLDCPVEEIEAHVTWSGTSGIDLLAMSFATTLAKLSLTMLEGYSFSIIERIGNICYNLSSLHLNFWSIDVADEEVLAFDLTSCKKMFPCLNDLNVKCEEHALTPRLFDFFLSNPSVRELRIVQYIAPLEWITDKKLVAAAPTSLTNAEMLILSNSSGGKMALGMEAVEALIHNAPNLSVLGNLRTWNCIDYYDPNSELFYKSESRLSKLKDEARRRNWDITLDLEDIDFLYK